MRRGTAEAVNDPRWRGLPSELKVFWALTLSLVAGCLAAEAISKSLLHLSGIYTWPFLVFRHWWDFRVFQPRFAFFHQIGFFSFDPQLGMHFMYLAPGAVLYQTFYSYRAHPIQLYLAVVSGCLLFSVAMFGRALFRRGMPLALTCALCGSVFLLSYPFWFEMLLGNLEICIWILVTAGVWAFFSGRSYAAAALFGIAGAIKMYPLIYLGLLLSARRYRPVVYALGLVAVLNLVSLWLVYPDLRVAWTGILGGLEAFRQEYLLPLLPLETGFDHSLFSIVKRTIVAREPVGYFPDVARAATIYLRGMAVLGLVLYFGRIRRLPWINQVLCLCVASVLMTPVSHDYTLIHLYVPWAMLTLFALDRWKRDGGVGLPASIPGLLAAMVCFAILFAPETEMIWSGLSYGGQVKALVLAVLLGVGLRFPFGARMIPAQSGAEVVI